MSGIRRCGQQSAASQRVWSDGTLQLEIQEADLVDAPLLRGVVRFCRMHVIARGVCTHTVLGALPVTVSSGCEGDIGAHVHVTRSTCLVQGGEARDDEPALQSWLVMGEIFSWPLSGRDGEGLQMTSCEHPSLYGTLVCPTHLVVPD